MSTDIRSSEWDSLISDKELSSRYFWAPWCPYCMRLKPVFDSVAKDYAENRPIIPRMKTISKFKSEDYPFLRSLNVTICIYYKVTNSYFSVFRFTYLPILLTFSEELG